MLVLGLVLGLVLVLGLGRGRGLRIAKGCGLRGRQREAGAPRQRVHDEVEPLEAVQHGKVVDRLGGRWARARARARAGVRVGFRG